MTFTVGVPRPAESDEFIRRVHQDPLPTAMANSYARESVSSAINLVYDSILRHRGSAVLAGFRRRHQDDALVLSVPAVLANSSDMQWGLAGNMLAMRHGGNRLTVSAAHIGDVAASVVFCEQRDGNGASLWVPMSSSFDGRQISTGQRSKNIGIREYGRRALLEAASVIGDVALHMRTTMAEGGPYAPQVQLTRQSELA